MTWNPMHTASPACQIGTVYLSKLFSYQTCNFLRKFDILFMSSFFLKFWLKSITYLTCVTQQDSVLHIGYFCFLPCKLSALSVASLASSWTSDNFSRRSLFSAVAMLSWISRDASSPGLQINYRNQNYCLLIFYVFIFMIICYWLKSAVKT